MKYKPAKEKSEGENFSIMGTKSSEPFSKEFFNFSFDSIEHVENIQLSKTVLSGDKLKSMSADAAVDVDDASYGWIDCCTELGAPTLWNTGSPENDIFLRT